MSEENESIRINRAVEQHRPICLMYDDENGIYIPCRSNLLVSTKEVKEIISDLSKYLAFGNIEEIIKENNENVKLENEREIEESKNYIDDKRNRPITPSYLYLMKSGEAIKIGISKTPEKRLKQLSIGNSSIELIYKILCKNAAAIEEKLHNRFKRKRIDGEWYALNQDDINYIKSKSW